MYSWALLGWKWVLRSPGRREAVPWPQLLFPEGRVDFGPLLMNALGDYSHLLNHHTSLTVNIDGKQKYSQIRWRQGLKRPGGMKTTKCFWLLPFRILRVNVSHFRRKQNNPSNSRRSPRCGKHDIVRKMIDLVRTRWQPLMGLMWIIYYYIFIYLSCQKILKYWLWETALTYWLCGNLPSCFFFFLALNRDPWWHEHLCTESVAL